MLGTSLFAIFSVSVVHAQFLQHQPQQQFPLQFVQQQSQAQLLNHQQQLLQPQSTVQIPKTGRILEPPIPELCANRQIHETYNGKGYYFSWKDPANNVERDWLDGRNFCRHMCMDLVSLETSNENEYIKSRIVEDQQKYIWTSGRLCNFKGCENRDDLKPIVINGWFWSGELRKLAPATNRLQNDWSNSGGLNKPQPDNREFQQGGAPESCIAILNNFYGDGVHWHDVACHHRKPIVCEDSPALLRYIRYTNPSLKI